MTSKLAELNRVATQSEITGTQAREAVLGCYVSIHKRTIERGASLLGQNLDDSAAESIAEASARRAARSLGLDYNNMSAADLRLLKVELDKQHQFDSVDADLRGIHDNTCNVIISKVR